MNNSDCIGQGREIRMDESEIWKIPEFSCNPWKKLCMKRKIKCIVI